MPDEKLAFLALDGDGVRNLSTLIILQQIMAAMNPTFPPKPCKVFNMIGGTGWGGIIAIMLGRLEMSVHECIEALLDLVSLQRKSLGLPLKPRLRSRFDESAFEAAIKTMLSGRGLDPETTLQAPPDAGCKVFVCTTNKHSMATNCLTSYYSPRSTVEHLTRVKIWEACRATTAVPGFLDPITIRDDRLRLQQEFVSGALGANNPVYELWAEAETLWGSARLEHRLKCMISIGSGMREWQQLSDELIEFAQALTNLATETEKTAERFRRERRILEAEGRYHRFNVSQGLEKVDWGAFDKRNDVSAATSNYLADGIVAKSINASAGQLSDAGPLRVNLLSIDGGGVRGLSSLLILQSIMEEITRIEVATDPSSQGRVRVPADYFDLAGGTSTGGLICIMLFRLRMDVETAIAQYKSLSPKIFHQGWTRYLGANIFRTMFGAAWFKGEALEEGVKQILEECLPTGEREQLDKRVREATLIPASEQQNRDHHPRSCRTFVCAFDASDDSAVRLRTYRHSSSTFKMCKIWEAARATSAAPFYFPSAKIADKKYWDGGLAYNNPALEVWAEAESLFGDTVVNCFISLGTGVSEPKPKRSLPMVLGKGKKILGTVTNTQRAHHQMAERTGNRSIPYFRFNASTGHEKIGLADYRLMNALEKYTAIYLKQEATQEYVKRCAELLAHRSTKSSAPPERPIGADTPTQLTITDRPEQPVVAPASERLTFIDATGQIAVADTTERPAEANAIERPAVAHTAEQTLVTLTPVSTNS